MNRGRFYATVMPIWGVLYVIGLIVFDSGIFSVVGALVFALLAVVGTAVIRPVAGAGRPRDRGRTRR